MLMTILSIIANIAYFIETRQNTLSSTGEE